MYLLCFYAALFPAKGLEAAHSSLKKKINYETFIKYEDNKIMWNGLKTLYALKKTQWKEMYGI